MAHFYDPPGAFTLITGGRVIDPAAGLDGTHDVLVGPGGALVDPASVPDGVNRVDATDLWVMPALIDLQVHFRQPGFDYKEDLATGSRAALAGGITTAVVMPNTNPSLDTPERVAFQGQEAARVHGVRILVAAAATKGLKGEELTDHGALKAAGAVAITDDGLPVLDDDLMAGSLKQCAEHDLLFMQHAEDTRMTGHAPMTEGPTSRTLGVRGQPADAEGVMVERDVALAGELGARYHVLHLSTARSLKAVQAAKAAGHAVSCEASPHHLLLTEVACNGADPDFKMNPPLRCEADRQALVDGLVDGTVDAVATDHAPHTAEEKARGFIDAPFGVIGLETAFSAVLSFVHAGVIDARRAVELMTSGPANVLRNPSLGTFGGTGEICVVDPRRRWTVRPEDFQGRSKNSAFKGRLFRGRVVATFMDGRLRYALDEQWLSAAHRVA